MTINKNNNLYFKNVCKPNKSRHKKISGTFHRDGDLSREICKICGNVNTVGFNVPEDIWKIIIPTDKQNSVVCLSCFTKLGDQKMIEWDKNIEFFPVSLVVHLKLLD